MIWKHLEGGLSRRGRKLTSRACFRPALEELEPRVLLSVFVVDADLVAGDSNPGDGKCEDIVFERPVVQRSSLLQGSEGSPTATLRAPDSPTDHKVVPVVESPTKVTGVEVAASAGQIALTSPIRFTADDGAGTRRQLGAALNQPSTCSFASAIQEANAHSGPDTIIFQISVVGKGAGPPIITDSVTIDGTSQGKVELAGAGLWIQASNSVVRSMRLLDSYVNGILLDGGASNNLIEDSVIVTSGQSGVFIFGGGGNIIRNNVIADNGPGNTTSHGIYLENSFNNIVEGNLIAANGGAGVFLYGGSSGNIIRSNRIEGNEPGNWLSHGVALDSASNNAIEANIIAMNGGVGVGLWNRSSGNVIRNNSIERNGPARFVTSHGLYLENSLSNTIEDNVVSANSGTGVFLNSGADGNLVQDNFIGTDASGTTDLGNSFDGVTIGGSSSNTVQRNVIAANGGAGVFLWGSSSGNVIRGNRIESNEPANWLSHGVALDNASNNTIEANIVAANGGVGVGLWNGSAGNVVRNNRIERNGPAVSSHGVYLENALKNAIEANVISGNGGVGVFLQTASQNRIGGAAASAGNVIGRNGGSGVLLDGAANNLIQGNFIGTDRSGATIGNGIEGVRIRASSNNNTIGGTSRAAGNKIAFNAGNGVSIESGSGNAILANAISRNGGLGIDLGRDGVTQNDAADSDLGPNGLVNFPQLTYLNRSPVSVSVIVKGFLEGPPNTTVRVQFFASDALDPSGYGEGQAYVREMNVSIDNTGKREFTSPPLNTPASPQRPPTSPTTRRSFPHLRASGWG